jgi:hypothetical protein
LQVIESKEVRVSYGFLQSRCLATHFSGSTLNMHSTAFALRCASSESWLAGS